MVFGGQCHFALRERTSLAFPTTVGARLIDIASTGRTQIRIDSLFFHDINGTLARLCITHLLRS